MAQVRAGPGEAACACGSAPVRSGDVVGAHMPIVPPYAGVPIWIGAGRGPDCEEPSPEPEPAPEARSDPPKVVYLDNAASTRVLPEVREAMERAAEGNPSSIHSVGRAARKQIEDARALIAGIVGVTPEEVIFTSGATEANNLAILGTVPRGGHVVTTAIEHPSVLEACAAVEDGRVTHVRVDGEGCLRLDELAAAVTPSTALVSVMLGNNEVGSVQPVREVAEIARSRGVPLHVDAAQCSGKMRVRLDGDFLTLSAHKAHGPKGVGVLVARAGTALRARAVGGGQEQRRRAGTENVAGIVGMARALELAERDLDARVARMRALGDRLRAGLSQIPDVRFNGSPRHALPHIVHATLGGVDGEAIVVALDAEGVCVSHGSACSSQSSEPSHVLLAMGLTADDARRSVRFSLGAETTEADIDAAIAATKRVVARLREVAPPPRVSAGRG